MRLTILVPVLLMALSVVGGFAANRLMTTHNQTLAINSLTARAGEMAEDLRQQVMLYQYGLRGARGAAVVAGGPEKLTLAQFRSYAATRSLATEFRGAMGFGIIRRVPVAEESVFIAQQHGDGRPDFHIRELRPHDAEHAVIQFIEPEAANVTAVGLDIASEPARHAAAIAAMRSGEPRLTAPISLVQAPGDAGGFLLLLPIYRQGADLGDAEARQAATVGWSYTPFLISRMIAGSELMRADVGFSVSDITDDAHMAPFYQTPALPEGVVDALIHEETLTIFGREWLIRFQATPMLLRALNLTPPLLAAAQVTTGGILLALLLHFYLVNLTRRHAAAREAARQTELLEREVGVRTAELAQREERFKTLTELSTDWYWETDRDGRFTAMSQGVSRIGQDHRGLIGKTRRDLSSDPRLEQYEDCVRRGVPFRDLAYDLVGEDGALRHIVISGTPILDAAGACVGYRGSGRDVTEQLRAEEALRASQRFIRAIADNIPGMVGYWDRDLRCRFANDRYRKWLGKTSEEILGQSAMALLDADLFAANKPYMDGALRGETQRFERTLTRRDGRPTDSWIHYMPDVDHEGAVQGFYVLVTDVTPLKRAERELRATSSRLALATKASGIAIWEYDVASGQMDWDEQMFRLYGKPSAEGHAPTIWREQCHPDDVARVETEFRRVAKGDADLDIEFRIRRPDGGLRHVKGASITERDSEGRPVRIIGVNWDITEVRDREAALVAAQIAAEAASRAKTDFLANMSHEIRTPMNAILGLTHLLGDLDLGPQQQDFVTKIAAAGHSLLDLINDILDFSKVEAGRLDLEYAELRLPDLVDGLLSLVSVSADERKLALSAKIAPGVPTAVVGDRLRLQQVALNLLGNAIKFTHVGDVAMTIDLVSRPAPDQAVLRFAVADTGIGIPREVIPTLFSAFTQADTSTTRRYGGSGLGLAICKRLVDLMGGEIGVDSQPGAGSTFWFTVPVRVAEQAAAPLPAPPAAEAGKRQRPKRLDGVRLLMVEDNAINQDVGRLLLQSEGATITIAGDGQQAVDRLRAAPGAFDLVLMDMQMPVMDGYEATRLIRGELGLASLPIIALTAGVLDAERARAYEAGINDFLTKPFDLEGMVATLRRHLSNAPGTVDEIAGRLRALVPDIDQRLALLGLADDWDLYITLLRRLIGQFGETVSAIFEAVNQQDWQAASDHLLALNAAAEQVAAPPVAVAAAAAETALRRQDEAACRSALGTLTGALAALAAAVR
ncbi:CHASE domain-containing protein [Nitrospirillum sp. BR 11828]|uniref:CHASE domain-containing protein n=1 Tax=Nitrospirillum sp. BR 11828 TaxID=3104325 RepID=UPI002ACA045E|nr:CHASE domain-containing protein [Nitrospirillum sp. BR 11828]MDZ5648033.1 CHASE domain-containing protein [Nitrospirillum sp. BR 11828]